MVVLVRHGETDHNRPPERVQGHRDVELNAVGRQQVAGLIPQLVKLNPQVIYTSPLQRAHETATIIGTKLQIVPVVDSRLMESNRGRWQGMTWLEVQEQEPDLYNDWRLAKPDFRFPEGESLQEHLDRVVAALTEIVKTHNSTVVVCHGGTIRMALCHKHGLGVEAFHRWEVPNAEAVKFE